MAAPQIPNLNTLRRGRGRGRGGRATDSGHDTRPAGKDHVVQGTDNDASVSRLSAVELGYLQDPYATILTPAGSATRRFPIINRARRMGKTDWGYPTGTYVRTTAIDHLVARFLGAHTPNKDQSQRKQIISLGAGSDTRVFRILSRNPSDLVYHEIDFAVNTSSKVRAIRSTPRLQQALGIDKPDAEVTVSETGDALHTPTYHLHAVDLRSLSKDSDFSAILPGVDRGLPTLLISECCLIYLSPTEAAQVVAFFTEHLFAPAGGNGDDKQTTAPLGLVLYEPIRPDDAFGRTMVSNLATRGIQLQTLHKYASLEAQRNRLKEQGLGSGQAVADIEFIWKHWVSEEEKERVSGLEMLDEVEEWQLLARHYCIAWAWRNGDNPSIYKGWATLEAQPGN
ncbi:hypothetical protein N7532_011395 [Penicillium argentinense]|uniref:Leucine carboxyl methyltransferase 1 n=1 Tax=Penicillium argentinense TaxID=1131581 RepID=A0A9W9JV73_9EURO|nr:uncharacterized protein N7532_011395 [Penicillium argentinense]KAJ5082352.1 hypothetical protein N7532_011395 [Penicillium argentinense]